MKRIFVVLVLPFLFLAMFSCVNLLPWNLQGDGYMNLSISVGTGEIDLKAAESGDLQPVAIIISIENAAGDLVYNAERLELYAMGDGYYTGSVELKAGAYSVTDFLVINCEDEIIYLTPKIGSEFEHRVGTPLPYAFTVYDKETTDVTLDVIPLSLGEPEAFGYAVFSFNIVRTLVNQPGPEEGVDALLEDYPLRDYTTRNFGTHEEFQASAWTADGIPLLVRSLIKFDLSAIPVAADIISARLYLYGVDETRNGPGHNPLSGSNASWLRRVTTPWDEMVVCWETQPEISDENQAYLACSDSAFQDYIVDVTDMVRYMVANPGENYGFMLSLETEELYRKILFGSSDYWLPEKRPAIEVSYR